MSALENQPSNKNLLSPFGFKFSIKKTPTINWFVQAVNLPSVSLNKILFPNPFINIPITGDHLEFGDLSITFRVDEDMKNYLEIYNWLQGIGFPDDFNQYTELAPRNRSILPGRGDSLQGKSIYSDASLMVLTSAMNPIIEIVFIDCFPTNLSELSFDTRLTDMIYVEATVTFAFRKFNFNRLI